MKRLLLIVSIFFIFISCNDDSVSSQLPEGTYTGVFIRSSPQARFLTSDVELTFQDQSFVGSSSIQNYPSICNGSFTVSGGDIEFTNSCIWTADFDWSYILSGKFELAINGDELIMTRTYEGDATDFYKLNRQ